MLYGLNDISLTPARVTSISHRSECNPYNFDEMLPLFTAPMNSLINEDNYQTFLSNKINTIIPRGVDYKTRWELSTKTFVAVSLSEFEQFIIDLKAQLKESDDVRYVCIDIANGHMKKLIEMCSYAKSQFGGKLLIMAGNIANPETYLDYAIAGIDFVRIGIGGGSVCTTSANGGVHYAMASLIIETAILKRKVANTFYNDNSCYNSIPFIVADGGFDNFDKIIKALALGADYVMLGKIFAQTLEACGEIFVGETLYDELTTIDEWRQNHPALANASNLELLNAKYVLSRKYYGMSTKKAQVETGNVKLKTAEGIEVTVPILYSLSGWCENFIDYLRSMMSYTDSKTLLEFQKTNYQISSLSEYLSFYK